MFTPAPMLPLMVWRGILQASMLSLGMTFSVCVHEDRLKIAGLVLDVKLCSPFTVTAEPFGHALIRRAAHGLPKECAAQTVGETHTVQASRVLLSYP